MSDTLPTPVRPYHLVARAYNDLVNVKASLQKENYERISAVLIVLDAVLRDLSQLHAGAPAEVLPVSCRNCGAHGAGL